MLRCFIFVIFLYIVVFIYGCLLNFKIDFFKIWCLKCCGWEKSFEFCVFVYLVNGEYVG